MHAERLTYCTALETIPSVQGWAPELLNQATLAELGAEAAVLQAGEDDASESPAQDTGVISNPLNEVLGVSSDEGHLGVQPAIPSSRGDVPLTALGNNGAQALRDLHLNS